MPRSRPSPLRALRGFTLLELIVVVLVLGILAGLAIVGYGAYSERAQSARVRTDLRQYANATLAQAVLDEDGDSMLSRADLLAALADSTIDVVDGTSAASLRLLGPTDAPTAPTDLAVAFDYGAGTPTNDTAGTRATLVSSTGTRAHSITITWGGAIACTGDHADGTTAATAASCDPGHGGGNSGGTTDGGVDDTADALSGWPVTIDVTANDTDDVGTVTSVTAPSHGTARVDTDGVTYVSADDYVGTDTFTYTTTTGAQASVTVTVAPLLECVEDPDVPAAWIPTAPGADGCQMYSPTEPPTTPTDPEPTAAQATAPIVGLTSYPHSSLTYPHVIYAATSTGGVRWVWDSGQSDGSAATGWLHAPGTFTNPTAILTGQGPGHGTLPSVFSIDSMFVADNTGVRVSRVNSFVRGTAPEYVLRADQYSGTIRSLAGYTCFDGNTPVPGNCLWFVTDAPTIGQVNVDTGAVREFPVAIPKRAGSVPPVKFENLQTRVENGNPVLAAVTEIGSIATYRPDGTLVRSTEVAGSHLGWVPGVVDGRLMLTAPDQTTIRAFAWPTGTYYDPTGDGTPSFTRDPGATAIHSHGVPDTFYWSQDVTGCLWRGTFAGASQAVWCPGGQQLSAAPITLPQISLGSGNHWDANLVLSADTLSGTFTNTRGWEGTYSSYVSIRCWERGVRPHSEQGGNSDVVYTEPANTNGHPNGTVLHVEAKCPKPGQVVKVVKTQDGATLYSNLDARWSDVALEAS